MVHVLATLVSKIAVGVLVVPDGSVYGQGHFSQLSVILVQYFEYLQIIFCKVHV